MKDLDKMDFQILYYLDINSRRSYSDIAKQIRTSPQNVKYRVERLYKLGIIRYAWPMVEYKGIGYFFGLQFIKLQNMTPKREKEFFGFLRNNPLTPIVMRGNGYADVIIAPEGKGIHHLDEVIRDLRSRFYDCILDCDTVIPIGFSRFYRNYLVGKEEETPQVAFTGAPKTISLDETERKVLSMLNYNARTPTLTIANKIRISYEKTMAIIKRLEISGVIQCYTLLPDHVKLGFPRYRILVKFKNLDSQSDKKFFTYCNFHPNIVHHLRVLGNWDVVIDIEVESNEKLRKILMEVKYTFSNVIQRIEPTYVYEIDKFRDIPMEYPELNSDEI